ncbi:MAG: hypothetical protein ACFFAS_03490 [Promethearchaeota archaeon]
MLSYSIIKFYYSNNINDKQIRFRIRIPPKGGVKVLLIFLMLISLLIPPVQGPFTIIEWNQVSILSYFRGIIFLVGLGFLPGACIHDIFLSNNRTYKDITRNFFLYKITIYPLLSYSYIGFCVIVLDQLNLTSDLITSNLFISILVLFFVDLAKNHKKDNYLIRKKREILASRANLYILLFLLGIFFVFAGIQEYMQYLFLNDSWPSISPALYIGDIDLKPFEDMYYYRTYPFFWGYISFGLSSLSGLPLINTNTLLVPYYLLYITSTYLMIKTLLKNYKERTIFFAVIFTIMLQSYQFFFFYLYKLFSASLLNVCMFLFINLLNNKIHYNNPEKGIKKNQYSDEIKVLLLISFLLMISFMTYIYPLIIAFIFLFLYVIINRTKKKDYYLKSFTQLWAVISIIYIGIDFFINFQLSRMMYYQFQRFFQIGLISSILEVIPVQYLFYSLFFLFILLLLAFDKLLSKRSVKSFKIKLIYKSKLKIKSSHLIPIIFGIIFVIDFIVRLLFFLNVNDEILVYQYSQQFDTLFFLITTLIFAAIIYDIYMYNKLRKNEKAMKMHIVYLGLFVFLVIIYLYLIYYYFSFFLVKYINLERLSVNKLIFILCKLITFLCPFSSIFTTFFVSFNIGVIRNSFFIFYIDILIYNLSTIGCLAIFLSYYVIKRDKKLLRILISWIITTFLISSAYIFYAYILYYPLTPLEISYIQYSQIYYWFSRLFSFSYLPLGIIASIGIFELIKKIKNHKLLHKRKGVLNGIRFFTISIVIFSFVSYPAYVYYFQSNNKYINDEEAQVIGWASENIPIDSYIILDDYKYELFLPFMTMTYCKVVGTYVVFKKTTYNQTEFDNSIAYLISKNFQYIVFTPMFFNNYANGYLFISEFYNQTLFQAGDISICYAPYFDFI